jgi:cytochrome c peroxidase
MSADGLRSCASCHDPAHGYSGGVELAADGKPNARRTPALVDLAWVTQLGWDGRAPSVHAMLPGHIAGQLGPLEAAAARIGSSPDAIVAALEAFVLTRYSGDAPWDSAERTANRNGTDRVTAGYLLFTGKAQCAQCHPPPLYTDKGFHAVVADKVGDKGRGLVDPTQTGAFRTPTLRNAMARTAFFHDGSATRIEATLGHSGVALSPDEQQNLVLFLGQLCGGDASAGCSR